MITTKYKYQKDTDSRKWVVDNLLVNARQIFCPDSRYDSFDIYYWPKEELDERGYDKNNKSRWIEIKTRNFNHNKYPTTIIEKDKYDKMTGSTFIVDIPVELIVLFEDGFVYYNAKDVKNMTKNVSKKKCPDQYDGDANKWCDKTKEVVEIEITENKFHPYNETNKLYLKIPDSGRNN